MKIGNARGTPKHSSLKGRINTQLPAKHETAHQLCFTIHDVMTQLLVSGRKAKAFHISIKFRDDADRQSLEASENIFDWLEHSRRAEERTTLLVNTVFPAVLGDMLHCFYEGLETSRKAKLGISYMLLRKPLQESLYVLESVVIDRYDFAEKLALDSLKLGSQKAGGVEVHTKRIQKVLDVLGETNRFDANYIARLRYDKEASDGFDGICNKAMHLFTTHKAILTEPLNINFIFSGPDSLLSQWSYLYSRLPYLLFYMHRIVEHICADIAPADPVYLQDMDRRISALILLWWDTIEPPYAEPRLRTFVLKTRDWLFQHCNDAGYRSPSRADLVEMADTGAYPGESRKSVAARNAKYVRDAKASGSL